MLSAKWNRAIRMLVVGGVALAAGFNARAQDTDEPAAPVAEAKSAMFGIAGDPPPYSDVEISL